MNMWVNCFFEDMKDSVSCPIFKGSRIYFKEISQIRIQTDNGFVMSDVKKGDRIVNLYSGKVIKIK